MDVVRFVTTVLIKADNGRIICILPEQFLGCYRGIKAFDRHAGKQFKFGTDGIAAKGGDNTGAPEALLPGLVKIFINGGVHIQLLQPPEVGKGLGHNHHHIRLHIGNIFVGILHQHASYSLLAVTLGACNAGGQKFSRRLGEVGDQVCLLELFVRHKHIGSVRFFHIEEMEDSHSHGRGDKENADHCKGSTKAEHPVFEPDLVFQPEEIGGNHISYQQKEGERQIPGQVDVGEFGNISGIGGHLQIGDGKMGAADIVFEIFHPRNNIEKKAGNGHRDKGLFK